jgi:hypothetical protein
VWLEPDGYIYGSKARNPKNNQHVQQPEVVGSSFWWLSWVPLRAQEQKAERDRDICSEAWRGPLERCHLAFRVGVGVGVGFGRAAPHVPKKAP